MKWQGRPQSTNVRQGGAGLGELLRAAYDTFNANNARNLGGYIIGHQRHPMVSPNEQAAIDAMRGGPRPSIPSIIGALFGEE